MKKAILSAVELENENNSIACEYMDAIKAVRELGSERRETVRSLSITGVGNLRRADLSTRGPGWTYRWCTCCSAKGIAG